MSEDAVATARAILGDFQGVEIICESGIYRIVGTFNGVRHAGARDNVITLAHDLAMIVRGGEALAPIAPVAIPEEEAVFVEPAPETAADEQETAASANIEAGDPAPNAPDDSGVRDGRELMWLRPDLWSTLGEAHAALRAHIQQEYAARTQTRAISLEAVLELAFLNQRTEAQEIELAQHRIWAERLRNVDGVLHAKLADVAALTSLEEARAYAASVEDGWQT